MPDDYVTCSTCGDAYTGEDPEDAGLTLCAGSVAWDPTYECDDCLRDCGPCVSEAARETWEENQADIRRFGP